MRIRPWARAVLLSNLALASLALTACSGALEPHATSGVPSDDDAQDTTSSSGSGGSASNGAGGRTASTGTSGTTGTTTSAGATTGSGAGGASGGATSTGSGSSTGAGSSSGNGGSNAAPVPVPPGGLALKVVGNHLVDAGGNTVRLLGVDRSGQEFKCIQGGAAGALGWGIFDGPTDLPSAQAIASWHANTVRVPLNEDCWLGINGVDPQYGGAAYRTAIANYVATLHQAGLYVILDLHWTSPGSVPAAAQQPMPDADHAIDFWTSVATTFAADTGVVFDLFNEPFIYAQYLQDPAQDPWECWLDGCTFNQYMTGGNPFMEPVAWKSAGMQQMVDAVRATGATNVLMAGGLEWSNDLTGWLAHEPQDPRHSLVASWHSYPAQTCSTMACWTTVIAAVAAQVPIVTGEVGDSVCNAAGYVPELLPWANAHGLSYLGWAWNTWGDCDNILIKDYSGTPTDNYGQAFHDMLVAANP